VFNIFTKIKNWLFPTPLSIVSDEWENQPMTKHSYRMKALGTRHELMLYLKYDAPIKLTLQKIDLSTIPVESLVDLCSMEVSIDQITYSPEFTLMEQKFNLLDNQNAYKRMQSKLMAFIKLISDYEKIASSPHFNKDHV